MANEGEFNIFCSPLTSQETVTYSKRFHSFATDGELSIKEGGFVTERK